MADVEPTKAWKEYKEALSKHNLKLLVPFGSFLRAYKRLVSGAPVDHVSP